MVEIAPADLRTRLEAGEPLKIVDIREADEYAAWHILGAENLPVYNALAAGNVTPLAQAVEGLSKQQPVVAVLRWVTGCLICRYWYRCFSAAHLRQQVSV